MAGEQIGDEHAGDPGSLLGKPRCSGWSLPLPDRS